jgi:transposase InsO family protein
MFAVLHAMAILVTNLFKSRGQLEAENVLRCHQLNVALRRVPARLRPGGLGGEAQAGIKQWHRHYNTIRPHSSLGYRLPAQEVIMRPVSQPVAIRPPLN